MQLKTKQDQVADLLRERIVTGEYERGKRLKQLEVAADFGVSVTPVREAFRMLEAEGFLVGDSHKGAIVPFLHFDQARELFELRIALECDLLGHAMENIDAEVLAEARFAHERCADAMQRQDRLAVRRFNYKLHFTLYEAAVRPQTLSFVRVIWARYPFHSLDSMEDRPPEGMFFEHDKILACIEKRDKKGAIAALDRHITNGWNEYTSYAQHLEQSRQRISEVGQDKDN